MGEAEPDGEEGSEDVEMDDGDMMLNDLWLKKGSSSKAKDSAASSGRKALSGTSGEPSEVS